MDRESMIEKIIDDDIQIILEQGEAADYLYTLLKHQIYEHQSLRQIIDEYNDRGLSENP